MSIRARVLIVDDDELVTEALVAMLEESYDVLCIGEAREAIAAISEQSIDVILLDFYLRNGSSANVAVQAERAALPVIWMTGEPDAVTGLAGVPHDVLGKPFHSQQLLTALAKAIRPRELRTS